MYCVHHNHNIRNRYNNIIIVSCCYIYTSIYSTYIPCTIGSVVHECSANVASEHTRHSESD